MALLQALKFSSQKISDLSRICDIFLLQQPYSFERRGQTDGVAPERGGVRSWLPSHEIGMCHRHAQRHTRGDALRNADDVRMKIKMLEREHFAGPPHPTL